MFKGSIALLLLALAVGLLLTRPSAEEIGAIHLPAGIGQAANQARLPLTQSAQVVIPATIEKAISGDAVSADVTPSPSQLVLQLPKINPDNSPATSIDTSIIDQPAGSPVTSIDTSIINPFETDMVEEMEQDPIGIQVMDPDYVIPEHLPDEGRGADSPRAPGSLAQAQQIVYGVNFMSSAEELADQQRYNNGKATGITWNRFPLYWHLIEESENNFNYSRHDTLISKEVQNGIIDNAILMGIPGFYFTDGRAVPSSLYQPIFSDGTDIPGAGKSINPNNKWAKYVFTTVNRYRPGGVLAQQQGWSGLQGIRQWELWNEPDLTWFWDGSKHEYARLLKVGYFAVNQADPQAQVIFGAIANNFDDINYYKDVLTILRDDPTPPRAQDYGYFHDILATHSYYYPWQSWYHVFRAKNAMGQFGIAEHGVWLNETGMSAWNDYPGPVWDQGSWYRGTMVEQAGYTIQTAMYALYAGADAIFHFQLYDACGNQPQGNDLPPHNGDLCTPDGRYIHNKSYFCSGDANGLYRNPSDAVCFTQHPNPETPRANFKAYQIVTEYLQDIVPLKRYSVCTHDGADDGQEWVGFYRPNTNQRIIGLWSCDNNTRTAAIPAVDTGALLIKWDGTQEFIAPAADGKYYITLPGATNQNYPNPNGNFWPVPGLPFILVERDLENPYAEVYAEITDGKTIVGWYGDDGMGAGIANFDIKVSVDGGAQQLWLDHVTETGKQWTGSYQYGVEFTVIGRDYGGNISPARSVLLGIRPPGGSPTATPTPPPNATPTATPPAGATPTPTTPPVVSTPEVTISVDRETTMLNDTTAYQIRIVNTSNVTLNSVTVRNEMPWQVDYFAGSAWSSISEENLSVNNDVLTWHGTLAPHETVTLGFRAVTLYSSGAVTTAANRLTTSYAGSAPITQTLTTTVIDPTYFTDQIYLPSIQR